MIGRRKRPINPTERKRAGGSGTNSKCPTWAYFMAFRFTNWVGSQGRRAPTRQSIYDVIRTTLYTPYFIFVTRKNKRIAKSLPSIPAPRSGALPIDHRRRALVCRAKRNCRAFTAPSACIAISGRSVIFISLNFRGRTGFDLKFEAQAACRGWFVGLVKNRTKTNKRRSRRSRSRGLIDRDVFAATPASGGNVDSRLANWRSDRAGL
jgi:hypothetical protein